MGTRNLTVVQHKGEYKVAQYGQWDGYPSGQGSTVLNFLHSIKGNLDHFKQKLEGVRFLSQEEYTEITNVTNWDEIRPELARNVAAEILSKISLGKVNELFNRFVYAPDSLLCEWAYVVDLDAEVLEVYEGFNHKAVTEGRFIGPAVRPHPECRDVYGPIKLVKSYPIAELPTVEQFILDCDPPREDCPTCSGNRVVQAGTPSEKVCDTCKGDGCVISLPATQPS